MTYEVLESVIFMLSCFIYFSKKDERTIEKVAVNRQTLDRKFHTWWSDKRTRWISLHCLYICHLLFILFPFVWYPSTYIGEVFIQKLTKIAKLYIKKTIIKL